MKNLIILIILGVGGYFAYQYFIASSQQASTSARTPFNMYSLPDKCQKTGENLKNAFEQKKRGEINQVNLNGFTQNFRRCLRRQGYTDIKIEEAYEGIKNSP